LELKMTKNLSAEVGKKYNHLTILELTGYRTGSTGRRKQLALCSCECGATKEIGLPDLRSGAIKTCGDLSKHPYPRRELKQSPAFVAGERFGLITLVSFVEYTSLPGGTRIPKMECLCDCGKTTVVSLWDLKAGKTTSCGAAHHRQFDDRSLPAFNNMYRNVYLGPAHKRGLVFELTLEQFKALTVQNCFYCGEPPAERHVKTGTRPNVRTSTCYANGVDRVDNSVGYVAKNVVPCCSKCNHAKHTMGQAEFLALARSIAALHPE
jgi:hypothetical protein